MDQIKRILALLLPVIWLLGATHCRLETAGWASPDSCCLPDSSAEGERTHSSHSCCSTDLLTRFEGGQMQILDLVLAQMVEAPQPLPSSTSLLPRPLVAPPEAILVLSCGWQFGSAAAVLPRAPSLLV